jgi:predicted transcriptional regulator
MAKITAGAAETREQRLTRLKALATAPQMHTEIDRLINLMGEQGVGKTGTAATASEFCPEILPATEQTVLRDVTYLSIEPGGIDALTDLKLVVPPEQVLNFGPVDAEVGPIEAWEVLVEIAASQGTRVLIVDSVSAWDSALWAYANTPEGELALRIDSSNPYSKPSALKNAHERARNKLRDFSGIKVCLFHPRPKSEDLGKLTPDALERLERKQAASAVYSQANIELRVAGSSRETWLYLSSFTAALYLDKEKTRTACFDFDPAVDMVCKNRMRNALPSKIKNFHIHRDVTKRLEEYKLNKETK